jgi:parallel beta-helix repeat protein
MRNERQALQHDLTSPSASANHCQGSPRRLDCRQESVSLCCRAAAESEKQFNDPGSAMDTLPRLFLAARVLLLGFAVLLVSGAADAQTLSVVPTSVSVQTNFGTNAPSQTVQVRKTGGGVLRWTVVQPSAPWVTVSPTSGANNASLILTFQTSGLAAQAQPYTTSFQVVSGAQSVTVNVAVTVVGSAPPPTLTITCPANISVASPDGSPVVVTYNVTTSGGNPPVNLTVTPQSGSSFSVGTTTVQANAQSQDGQTKSCSFTVTVTPPSSNWTFCAAENQFCAFSGTTQVRYGANNTFFIRTLTGGTPCTNDVFGDPIFGTAKHCDVSTPPPTLTITCPANITVASPNGSPVVVTYTVTTSGGNPPVNLTVTPQSGSSFPVGTTTVQANAQSQDGQTKNCSFTVTVTPPSSTWTFCAFENQFCAFSGTQQVRYGANATFVIQTLTGGTQCTNAVFGDPIPGTAKHCDINSVQPSGVGPQTSITCPAGAADIFPGQSIQLIVNANAAGTAFCLRAGSPHQITASITPKSGDSFTGEYGAILDGTGWSTTDVTAGAFRASDQDIDNVTIRNLVIKNMPKQAIYASYHKSDGWTIDFNELTLNQTAVSAPNNSQVKNNYIHHNSADGYSAFQSSNILFEANEIAYNGSQKVIAAKNVTFRNNFVHHNTDDGIWYDGDSSGGLVEGNVVEDNGREGIFTEISAGIVIRNNASRRNAANGIFISTSKNIQVYNNIVENNLAGIQYFLNCAAVGGGSIGWDLADNTVHDNQIKVAPDSVFANLLNYSGGTCTSSAQVAPYLNGMKNLTFANNTYLVPSLTTKWFVWGFAQLKSWSEWQALGNDTTGSYQLY